MPDFERLLDDLRTCVAREKGQLRGEPSDYWRGFAAGKTWARKELAVLIAVVTVVVLISYLVRDLFT